MDQAVLRPWATAVPRGQGSQKTVSVEIVLSDDLPDSIPVAAQFTPGRIVLVVRAGLSQAETVSELAAAFSGIQACYDPQQIHNLNLCDPEQIAV